MELAGRNLKLLAGLLALAAAALLGACPPAQASHGGEHINTSLDWWSPCFSIDDTCSPDGPAGGLGTEFTFSAEFESETGVAAVHWDFDGDGAIDHVESLPEPQPEHVAQARHTFSRTGVFVPRVRGVDGAGEVGEWEALNLPDGPATLIVGDPIGPPIVTLGWWSPCNLSAGGAGCVPSTPATPDGRVGDPITFGARVHAGEGISMVEWDYDEDGLADALHAIGLGHVVTAVELVHSFSTARSFEPRIRITDHIGSSSEWTPLYYDGQPVRMNIAVSEACVSARAKLAKSQKQLKAAKKKVAKAKKKSAKAARKHRTAPPAGKAKTKKAVKKAKKAAKKANRQVSSARKKVAKGKKARASVC